MLRSGYSDIPMEFMRFTAHDADALAKGIDETRLKLERALPATEPIGWFWNAYATALQYADERAEVCKR